jgi:hypothetical protein
MKVHVKAVSNVGRVEICIEIHKKNLSQIK